MDAIVHTLHVLLARVWLGGVVFTTFVVSLALKTMKWSEGKAERVLVRSVIEKRYGDVGASIYLMGLFALLDGVIRGFGAIPCLEGTLLALLFGLVDTYGAYFGSKLRELTEAERRSLQKASFRVPMLDIVVSAAVLAFVTKPADWPRGSPVGNVRAVSGCVDTGTVEDRSIEYEWQGRRYGDEEKFLRRARSGDSGVCVVLHGVGAARAAVSASVCTVEHPDQPGHSHAHYTRLHLPDSAAS